MSTLPKRAYDNLNRLLTTTRDNTLIDTRFYDAVGRVQRMGMSSVLHTSWFDQLYGAGVDGTGRTIQVMRYDANGRVNGTRVLDGAQNASYTTGNYSYDAAGNLTQYQVITPSYTNTYTSSLVRRDAYKEGTRSATSTYFQPGSVTHAYDGAGNLTAVTDATSSANNRSFVNDAAGRILLKSQNGALERQLVVNGEVLAYFKGTSADFKFGYAPISGSYPAAVPGAYTVTSEDSLQSIAKAAYGDSSLWYRIAEANGMTSDRDLRVGQTLTVPAQVNSANSASSFQPYDPSEIIGDTTPNMPNPPPPKKKCGFLGKILMIIIAVVATVFTAGALAGATGSLASMWSAGVGVMSGGAMGGALGSFVAGGLSTAATAGIMAGAAAVGSIASQLAGNALGVIDGFSWKSVAISALSAGISTGLPPIPGFGEGTAQIMAKAAVGNALTQGVAVITGLQDKFDWKGVAASAAAAGVGAEIGQALGLRDPQAVASMTFGEQLLKRTITGLAAGTTAALMRGGKVATQQIATDAFGNALGESLTAASSSDSQRAIAAIELSDSVYGGYDPTVATSASAPGNPVYDYDHRNSFDAADDAYNPVYDHDSVNEFDRANPTTTASPRPASYKEVNVKSGQTLSGITGRSDADYLDRVAQFNGLKSRHEIKAGQTLRIPDDATLMQISVSSEVSDRGAAGAVYYADRQAKLVEAARAATDAGAGRGFVNPADASMHGDYPFAGRSTITDPQAYAPNLSAGEWGKAAATGIWKGTVGSAESAAYSYGLIGTPQQRADWAIQTVTAGIPSLGRFFSDMPGSVSSFVGGFFSDDPSRVENSFNTATGLSIGVASGVTVARLVTPARVVANVGSFSLDAATVERIQNLPKGSRPDPTTYIPVDVIDAQLAAFDNGASRFMLQKNLDKYGPAQADGTSFVMTRTEADRLVSTAKDARSMEDALGLPAGTLNSSTLVRVDVPRPKELNLRIPSGNEAGANTLWIPGGKLPNGYLEGVIDLKFVPATRYSTTPLHF